MDDQGRSESWTRQELEKDLDGWSRGRIWLKLERAGWPWLEGWTRHELLKDSDGWSRAWTWLRLERAGWPWFVLLISA